MDQETKAYLDEHFARQDVHFARQGEQLAWQGEQLAQQGEQLARQGEQLARQGEQLAQQEQRLTRLEEGVADNSRQIGELKDESRQTRVLLEGIRSDVRLVAEGVVGLSERLEAHQREVKAGFEDVKASIAPAYQRLDGRVQGLEARAERQTRDVLDVIREKFGKPQA